MPSAANASLQYEASQSAVAMAALADSGDAQFFKSGSFLWSDAEGYAADVKPDGVLDNATITPASGDNVVKVAAFRANLGGTERNVSATASVTIDRPTESDYLKYSIILESDGSTVSALAGTEGTSFSDTRGVEGGPPLITAGAIEIGQVHLSSKTAAAILASEIKQVPGTHQERHDFPAYDVLRSNVTNGIMDYAGVEFYSALPKIHVGEVPKGVYASYYEPEFTELRNASDFKPPETTHSVSSKTVYRNVVGSRSSSLGSGSFNVLLENGVDDALLKKVDQNIWFKFLPNYLETTKYKLCQGVLGVATSFPADDSINASCTISAETAAVNVTG